MLRNARLYPCRNRRNESRIARQSASLAALLFIALALVAGLAATVPANAATGVAVVPAGSGQDAASPEIRVISKTDAGLSIEFTLPALQVEAITVGGQSYDLVAIPGGASAGAVGEPMIPVYNRFVAVPEGATVRVVGSVEEEEALSGFHLMPVQDEDETAFSINAQAYARDSFGDEPSAKTGNLARMRGLRIIPVTFAPVRFNPAQGKLLVARKMRVEVSFAGSLGAIGQGIRSLTPSFDRLYRNLVINYDGPPSRIAPENGSWLAICPNDAGVLARLQPLADWRQRSGYPVRVVTTAETGTTEAAIKAYIQNAYDTWETPPEYVALVADANGTYMLPTWYSSYGEGDHPYSQMDGDDLIPDLHVGRVSYSSYTELEVIVSKTVGYETAPPVSDPGWFTRACLVGDPQHSGLSTVQTMQWIKTRLRQIGYAPIDTVFGGNFVGDMATALNRGDTIFSYRGYIGMSGWQNSNTFSLTNVWKLHFGVMSTCGTGNFAHETSRTEAFLRAGSVAAPIAGIGAIGTATSSTHTRFNNCFTMGVFQGLLYENIWEMGAAHSRGKFELVMNYAAADPSDARDFCTWNNLMGDPACPIWTAYPTTLVAAYPATLPLGANSVRLTVRDSASRPIANARVCLWKGTETFSVGMTDDAGVCELLVATPTSGTMKLTVTKHNCIPLLADIAVASGAFVGYDGSQTDDDNLGDSQGNGDSRINPGETIELPVQLHNFGSSDVGGVAATITSLDPYVTILDGQEDYPAIAGGASAWSADDFDIAVSPTAPHGHTIRLGLDVTSGANLWHSLIELPVVSADLAAGTVTLYNSGNGRLDPGESLEISVPLVNGGGADAAGTVATLESLSPWVTVTDAAGNYGMITAGGSGENTVDRFAVQASPSTYDGHLAVFRLLTTFNGGAVDTAYCSLTVGQRASDDPVGPDHYGYLAYDNTDTRYLEAPTYSWIELDPNFGGQGYQVVLGDYADYLDKTTTLDLPIQFQFYGQDQKKVSICSNGWISFGGTYLTDYRNWTIPGAGSPANLVAVYWDDLKERQSGAGHVYQRLDAANHRWIVEWSRLTNAYGGDVEIFEVILYDTRYYPTTSGDGIIVFQYNQASSSDVVDGYATVGIENADHTDGLLYAYFNRYPAGAATIASGRAIRFIPGAVNLTSAPQAAAGSMPVTALEPARPNPFSRNVELAFSLERSGDGRLGIYDVQGRCVREILNGLIPAGAHHASWDGRDALGHLLPSGTYFYRLETAGQTMVQKVIRLE